MAGRVAVVAVLGTTQTIAWASSYYMPAILGVPIASALHLPTSVFFGLFSGALLLSAVVGPSVGRLIDRHGGRVLLAASNLVIAAGLVILAAAHGIAGLVIAWAVLGVGIGMGLYDPAFAALTWLYGREARSAITGITLIAGFASTIGWPMSAVFLHEFGWRAACLIWAGLNVLLAAPLNWLSIPRHGASAGLPQIATELPSAAPPRATMPILGFFFAATWFVQGAMAAHLPGLLQAAGASSNAAIAAAALVGPAQVGARTRRVRIIALVPPDCFGAARFSAASSRRRVRRPVRSSRDRRIRAAARRRQRSDHDRQRHFAASIFRTARLWAAQRVTVGTGPRASVGLAVPVRPAPRPGRDRGGGIVGRALPRCLRLTVPAAAARSRRGPPVAGPRLRRESSEDAIVQVGPSPPTAGSSAEAKSTATEPPSPRKRRALFGFYSV